LGGDEGRRNAADLTGTAESTTGWRIAATAIRPFFAFFMGTRMNTDRTDEQVQGFAPIGTLEYSMIETN
jgi:hypothetical protein